jgi:flagellar biosynthesis protein FliQ
MTTGAVSGFMQQALWAALAVGGPLVVASLVVGLVVSIFQAATQINEGTLTFVPKVIVIVAILAMFGQPMLTQLVDFARYTFQLAASVGQ